MKFCNISDVDSDLTDLEITQDNSSQVNFVPNTSKNLLLDNSSQVNFVPNRPNNECPSDFIVVFKRGLEEFLKSSTPGELLLSKKQHLTSSDRNLLTKLIGMELLNKYKSKG